MHPVNVPGRSVLIKLAADSGIYLIGRFVGTFIPLLTLPLITRILGPELYGVLELLLTIGALIQVVVATAPVAIFNYYYFRPESDPEGLPHRRRELMTAGVLWHVAVGFLALFGLLGVSRWVLNGMLSVELSWLTMVSFGSAVLIQQLVAYFVNALRMQERAVAVVLLQVSVGALTATLGLAGAVLAPSGPVAGYWVGFLSAQIIACGIGAWLLRKHFVKLSGRRRVIELSRSTILFGVPLIPAALAEYILGFADRLLLLPFVSGSEFGAYALAGRVATLAQLIAQAMMFAFLPFAMRLIHGDDSRASVAIGLVWRYVGAILLTVVAVTLTLARPLIQLVGGDVYADAVAPLTLLMLAHVFYSYTYFTYLGTLKAHRTGLFSVAVTIGAAATILAALLWIPTYGIVGAAGGRLVGAVVATVLSMYFSFRVWPIDLPLARVTTQAIAVLALALATTANLIPSTSMFTIGASVLTLILVYSLAYRPSDRHALSSF